MPHLVRDGVRLAWEERGSGAPALLCIHGWAGDHRAFAPQLAQASRQRRVVAPDLRGHGASDRPEQEYTVTGLAADVAWLCDRLGLRGAVAAGHSLGGLVTLALASARPDLVAAVALIDAPVAPTPRIARGMDRIAEALATPGWQAAAHEWVEEYLITQRMPLASRQAVLEALRATPQHVMLATMRATCTARDALPTYAGPLLCIDARLPLNDPERLRALYPQAVVEQVPEAGHYAQLEAPAKVNWLLRRFIAQVAAVEPPQ